MVGLVRLRPFYEPSQTINHFKCAHNSAHYLVRHGDDAPAVGGLGELAGREAPYHAFSYR